MSDNVDTPEQGRKSFLLKDSPLLAIEKDIKQETDEDEEGKGGSGTLLWQGTEEEGNLLPAERAALLDKIVRGMVSEGHLAFGPKALKKLLSEEKIRLYNLDKDRKAENTSGNGQKKHPLLPQGSGLRAEVSPEWKNNNKNANTQKDALLNKHKLQNKLANKQKLIQIAKPKAEPKLDIKYAPKFNPRPPGM
ncbi:MAG: hypothetical protein JWM09_1168 [Francisellaceae bacterium]|nr:hypothetical protein [Francisellaceae bacterium]